MNGREMKCNGVMAIEKPRRQDETLPFSAVSSSSHIFNGRREQVVATLLDAGW